MNLLYEAPGVAVGIIVLIGVASFGIVDLWKMFSPGIDSIGFRYIRKAVVSLTPEADGIPENSMPQSDILRVLRSKWAAGLEIEAQKAFAKSFVEMHLSPTTAPAAAAITNINPGLLRGVASSIAAGMPLSQQQDDDIYKRFDSIVAALLDEAYTAASRTYRNGVRALSSVVCLFLGFLFVWMSTGRPLVDYWWTKEMAEAILMGLAAAPVAPVAKDISTAISTAIKSRVEKAL